VQLPVALEEFVAETRDVHNPCPAVHLWRKIVRPAAMCGQGTMYLRLESKFWLTFEFALAPNIGTCNLYLPLEWSNPLQSFTVFSAACCGSISNCLEIAKNSRT